MINGKIAVRFFCCKIILWHYTRFLPCFWFTYVGWTCDWSTEELSFSAQFVEELSFSAQIPGELRFSAQYCVFQCVSAKKYTRKGITIFKIFSWRGELLILQFRIMFNGCTDVSS